MSKYKERGPYHFVEFADSTTPYHKHVTDFTNALVNIALARNLNHIHEVGCGEGLILSRMRYLSMDKFHVSGNEIDKTAIMLASACIPQADIAWGDISKLEFFRPEVVIFSDSLEHITNWRAHIDWAKEHALVVALAWPSTIDKHAITQFSATFFDQYFPEPWKCEYRKTRDYRHVTIWTRPDP